MTETKSLLTALHAVQGEAPTLPKDATNPHFKSKYTSLDAIVERIGPILGKHGLIWTTLPCRDEHGDPALRYRLAHVATGEELEGVMPLLLAKEDSQGMGSALTYARRYSLCAVLNLVADEDDDGSAASNGQAKDSAKSSDGATSNQKRAITTVLNKAGVARDFQKTIVHAVGGDPLTKAGASKILDVLNRDDFTPEQNRDKLIELAGVEWPSDLPPPDESDFEPAERPERPEDADPFTYEGDK